MAWPDGTPWSEQALEAKVKPKLGVTWKALPGRLAKLAAGQIADGLREIHAIEDIEKIRAEFKAVALEGERLRELHVDVRQSRTNISIPSEIPLASQGRRRECRG